MNTKKCLREYLGAEAGKAFRLVLGAFAVLVGISSLNHVDTALVWFGLGGLAIFWAFSAGAVTDKWIRVMEREGKLETVLTDFQHASECLGGKLRLGQYWFYGKIYSKTPLAYGDILRVYQLVRKKGAIVTGCYLMAVTTSGKTRKICEVPWTDNREQELNQVVAWMLSKNPAIQVGYKK